MKRNEEFGWHNTGVRDFLVPRNSISICVLRGDTTTVELGIYSANLAKANIQIYK